MAASLCTSFSSMNLSSKSLSFKSTVGGPQLVAGECRLRLWAGCAFALARRAFCGRTHATFHFWHPKKRMHVALRPAQPVAPGPAAATPVWAALLAVAVPDSLHCPCRPCCSAPPARGHGGRLQGGGQAELDQAAAHHREGARLQQEPQERGGHAHEEGGRAGLAGQQQKLRRARIRLQTALLRQRDSAPRVDWLRVELPSARRKEESMMRGQ